MTQVSRFRDFVSERTAQRCWFKALLPPGLCGGFAHTTPRYLASRPITIGVFTNIRQLGFDLWILLQVTKQFNKHDTVMILYLATTGICELPKESNLGPWPAHLTLTSHHRSRGSVASAKPWPQASLSVEQFRVPARSWVAKSLHKESDCVSAKKSTVSAHLDHHQDLGPRTQFLHATWPRIGSGPSLKTGCHCIHENIPMLEWNSQCLILKFWNVDCDIPKCHW